MGVHPVRVQSHSRHVAKVAHNRPLLVFIIAFMLFNDGVQTTIALAAVYATETLDLGSRS